MRPSGIRAAVYARVSSEQQAQAGTIGSQLEALRRRVIEDGLVLETELEFLDDGYSGATLIRPALERLRDMAAAGSIDRVYVHSPDRLARKYAYQVLLVDELRRCAVQVVFLNHGVGDSPEDSLLLQVQGMVAEYERAKIMERCRRGKLHAARKGLVNVLSGAPYGYRYLPVSRDGGEAQYQIELEEAKVVRQVFQWVGKEGASIGQVRKRLHENNIAAPSGKSWWDRATVWGMLRNPAYKGQAAFGKTRVGERRPRLRPQRGASAQPRWPYSTYEVSPEAWTYIPIHPIVGESLFATVQERLAENRKRSRERARGARHLLQGLLVCARCGYAYYGKPISLMSGKGKKRDYVYYRCTGTDAYRFAGQRVCSNRQLRSDLLEQAVWRDVCSLLSDPARIEQEYQRRVSRKVDDELETAAELRSAIQKLRRGISRLIDSYQSGLVEKAEFEPRMRIAREKLKRLQTDLQARAEQEQQDAGLQLVLGRMREFAEKVGGGLANADWATRRAIIRAVVKEIKVDDEEVRIVYKVAPDPPGPGPREGSLQHCSRSGYSSLGYSPLRSVTAAQSMMSALVALFNRGFQPQLDQFQHLGITDPPGYRSHKLSVRNFIEVSREIRIYHVRISLLKQLMDPSNGVLCAFLRPIGVRVVCQIHLEDRRQHQVGRRLNYAVTDTRNSERTLACSIRLGDVHPPNRSWSIPLCPQFLL